MLKIVYCAAVQVEKDVARDPPNHIGVVRREGLGTERLIAAVRVDLPGVHHAGRSIEQYDQVVAWRGDMGVIRSEAIAELVSVRTVGVEPGCLGATRLLVEEEVSIAG